MKLNALLKEGKIPESCLYYKFIDNTSSFAMIDPTNASSFKWDDDVCEFFDTIKYLGGERTRNFVRGPGFHGSGKGGLKEFESFSDFNLCGPSTNASKRNHAGYTTESGILKPHLQSLYSFSHNPNANLHSLLETDKVKAVPISLTMDGTALKPGLEFDPRQKTIIGLRYKVDHRYIREHPIPDPEEIKTSLITSADVTYATTLDNGATMPVGVHYRPKAVTGEEILTCFQETAKTVQTCERCLKRQHCDKHIVTSDTANCRSVCEQCIGSKSVCASCKEKGHESYIPSLRACDSCLRDGVTCNKMVALAVVTDCESCNKKALLELDSMADDNLLPPELKLLVPLPDVVHIGKSLKCSWSNWFIELDGELSNLVLLRTLRDRATPEIRTKLRKLLSLECVRNKDRMAVEPIIRLTAREVLEVLQQLKCVVHTIVPEKYRFWKSNQAGACTRPIAVSPGPHGTLLVLDYNFISGSTKLVSVRLHQPADVSIEKEGFRDARDLCYDDGVVFIAERGSGVIQFVDLKKCVAIKPGSLKRRADLVDHLKRYNLSLNGTVPVLRERLQCHLERISATLKNKDHVQVLPLLSKPTAICKASKDVLLCADDEECAIFQIILAFDGVTIHGRATKITNYPENVSSVGSIAVLGQLAYFSVSPSVCGHGGLFRLCLQTKEAELVLSNATRECSAISKLAVYENRIVFTDAKSLQVKAYNAVENSVSVFLGSGQEGLLDGTADTCSFTQLQGICSYEKSLFVTDVAGGLIKLVSGLTGTVSFLETLGCLYSTFGIHIKGKTIQGISLQDAKDNVTRINKFMQSIVAKVKVRHQLKETTATNGPEGTVSKLTQDSLNLLKKGMDKLTENIKTVNPSYVSKVELATLLTTQVENLHAVSHFKHDTFSALQYAQDFGTIVKESLKRTMTWTAKYFTHDKSYYPIPQTAMPFSAATFMKPAASVQIPKDVEVAMKDWMESYRPVRQRTVRSETTKDKAGALPPAVYSKPKQSCTIVEFPQNLNTTNRTNLNQEDENPQNSRGVSTCQLEEVVDIAFVNEADVSDIFVEEAYEQTDEYETDSDDEPCFNDVHKEPVGRSCVTRSGRAIRAYVRLDI